MQADLELSRKLASQLRIDAIRCSTRAGSGHPTSAMSAADLLAVLVTRHLRYDWSDPKHPANDYLIFSKGHVSTLLYACLKAVGVISDEELLTYRTQGSRLQGHPTPVLPWVCVATGSLGQGLPVGVGVALAGKHLERAPYRVWVLCGDGELAEGSMWEAFAKASMFKLSNLTAIVDVNRLGQCGETELGWDLDAYRRRVEAFGCEAIPVDGHDLAAIDAAYAAAARAGRPSVILARTVKGMGFAEVADNIAWHGRALPPEVSERAIAALGGNPRLLVRSQPVAAATVERPEVRRRRARTGAFELPRYRLGERVAPRLAFGEALRAIGASPEVIVLDADLSTSTYSNLFAKAYPERFFQLSIAEQQLVATAVGLAERGYAAFLSTYAAFLSRAYDFLRMAAVTKADLRVVGSHGGVEIGPEGPSQMGLEDLAAMRAIHGSTVLYPSDANSMAKAVRLMLETDGIVYLRSTRNPYPVVYSDEPFVVGGSRVLREGSDVALLSAGATLHGCLQAAELLEREGIRATVVDVYSVKPIDAVTLRQVTRATEGRIVVAEDHYPEGGLGAAVFEALASSGLPIRAAHLAVRGLPGCGTPQELLAAAGISAADIAFAAQRLVTHADAAPLD